MWDGSIIAKESMPDISFVMAKPTVTTAGTRPLPILYGEVKYPWDFALASRLNPDPKA